MDPTESTPLIVHPVSQIPPISTFIQLLHARGIDSLNEDSILSLCPESLRSNPAKETSFALVLLLQLRLQQRAQSSSNSWDRWSQENRALFNADHLEEQTVKIWSRFVEQWCSDDALQDVLTTPFQCDDKNDRSVTFLQLLGCGRAPTRLLSHPLLELSVHNLWTAGFREFLPSDSPFAVRVFNKIKRFSTPRVMHAFDLLMHIVYITTLVHFVTSPPVIQPLLTPSLGLREVFITVFSFASLLRRPNPSTIPHALLFLSFAACLPSSPLPGDFSYDVLLFGLTLYLVQLHLPHAPSPIFFVSVRRSVPLSTFLWDGFKRIYSPILIFYVPIFTVSIYLISFSLSDTFFREVSFSFFTLAAPIETRGAFLSFCGLVVVSFFASLTMSSSNFVSILDANANPWDRYSLQIGLESRRTFANAVWKYGNTHFFPTPLNLLPLVFVEVPTIIFIRILGRKDKHPVLLKIETCLWATVVLPMSTIIAGFWLWGQL